MKKPVLLFTILLTALALLLIFWLCLESFPYLGVFRIEAVLGQSTPLISSIGPEVRTKLSGDYQTILESPVYFEFRALPWFTHAQVSVTYEPTGGHDLVGLGRHTGPDFSYTVQAPTAILRESEQTKKAIFDFDLSSFYQEKNMYRVLIDTTAHQYQVGSELHIKEIKILLSRP